MLIVGLTGGIASGKSAASYYFQTLGAAILSADVLAREVVAAGSEGLTALVETFGESILLPNGELDRHVMREQIFASVAAREKMDALLHPRINALSDIRIAEARDTGCPYLIYEIPLLVETDQIGRFDRVLVVDVPEQMQIERLLARDDTSQQQAQAILSSQASREERLAAADDIIDNSGTLADLQSQVEALHQRYTDLANSRSTTG